MTNESAESGLKTMTMVVALLCVVILSAGALGCGAGGDGHQENGRSSSEGSSQASRQAAEAAAAVKRAQANPPDAKAQRRILHEAERAIRKCDAEGRSNCALKRGEGVAVIHRPPSQ
jgi:hypothetical protein